MKFVNNNVKPLKTITWLLNMVGFPVKDFITLSNPKEEIQTSLDKDVDYLIMESEKASPLQRISFSDHIFVKGHYHNRFSLVAAKGKNKTIIICGLPPAKKKFLKVVK